MSEVYFGHSDEPCYIDTDGILHWQQHQYAMIGGATVAHSDTVIQCPFDAFETVAQWMPYKPSVVFVGDVRCYLLGSRLTVGGKLLKVTGPDGKTNEAPDAVFLSEDQTRRLIAGDKSAADDAVEEHYRDRTVREEIVAGPAPRYAEPKAAWLGDGWHVLVDWHGFDHKYTTLCGQRFFLHGPRSCSPTRIAEVTPDLWPEAEPAGRVCGCYWYFRREELKP